MENRKLDTFKLLKCLLSIIFTIKISKAPTAIYTISHAAVHPPFEPYLNYTGQIKCAELPKIAANPITNGMETKLEQTQRVALNQDYMKTFTHCSSLKENK